MISVEWSEPLRLSALEELAPTAAQRWALRLDCGRGYGWHRSRAGADRCVQDGIAQPSLAGRAASGSGDRDWRHRARHLHCRRAAHRQPSTHCASASLMTRNTGAKARYLFGGVVDGISFYGNALGIPCVAGEVAFNPSYRGNCLVGAMSVGVVASDKIASSAARGRGQSGDVFRQRDGARWDWRLFDSGVARDERLGSEANGAGRRPLFREVLA